MSGAAKTWDELYGEGAKQAQTDSNAISSVELGAYSQEELKTLVRRLLCQCGAVAMMTDDETAQAILDRFASEAITGDIKQAITAGTAWFDRKKGKPAQSQAITVDASVTTTQVIGVSSEHMIDMMQRYIEKQKRYLPLDHVTIES